MVREVRVITRKAMVINKQLMVIIRRRTELTWQVLVVEIIKMVTICNNMIRTSIIIMVFNKEYQLEEEQLSTKKELKLITKTMTMKICP